MYRIPYFLKPKVLCDLQRVGNKNDGGYVIPKKSLQDTEILISFGLSDDWSFEKEFHKFSNSKVLCFDNSVNGRFWIVRFIKSLISIITFNELGENIKKLFTYLKYIYFFNNKNKIHYKKFIIPNDHFIFGIDKNNRTDLNEIFKEFQNKNIFLKIDIEGSEYRILHQIISNQKNLSGLVIELHDCDLHFEKIKKFIDNFDLDLVHLHVNNFCSINNLSNPSVIELTFCDKKLSYMGAIDKIKYPVKNLDSPCNKKEKDAEVVFY